MFDTLKLYLKRTLPFTDSEIKLVDKYFETISVAKRGFVLSGGKVCDFIGFIHSGSIRHFHVKEAVERTCDISFENTWVTDFQSFTFGKPSSMNLQALEDSTVFVIRKNSLSALYAECGRYETFGRLMAEQVARRATEIAMSLSSDKPEERYLNLITNEPDIFQRVQQKYIANYLGISPESLSRIRNRIVKKQRKS